MSDAVLVCPPETINPDWHLAKALYLQGLPAKSIASQANVPIQGLNKRITREGWCTLKTNTNAILSVTVQTGHSPTDGMSKAQGEQLTDNSAIVRNSISGELLATSNDIVALKRRKSSQGILERLTLLEKLSEVSKTVFGWNDATNGGAIRVSLLSTAQVLQAGDAPKQLPSSEPIIDVPTVTER